MDKFTIACVQMQMRMHASLDDYRDDLRRFLRAAEAKRARLILFPEMAGLMLAPLLLGDARTNLLRRAEVGRKRSAGAWEKVSGKAAGWLAQALKADLGAATAGLLDVEPQRMWEAYADLFGGLARAQGVTIVAPSAWLPDPAGGASGAVLRNLSAIFGPGGELLGTQAKVLGALEDEARVAKGVGWRAIPTEVGRVGLLLGSDVLYPEVGRVLAYQNAEMLLLQGACADAAAYHKLRAAILARMQDNQLYAAASFVVGANPLRKGADPYTGRSVILAPQELTPKYNGVLVEMGSAQSEGVVTAEWDYAALKRLWETSETSIRRALTPEDAAPVLAALYTQLRALPQAPAVEMLPLPSIATTAEITLDDDGGEEAPLSATAAGDETDATETSDAAHDESAAQPNADPARELEDLPLLGSVRSHWPLHPVDAESVVSEEIVEPFVPSDAPSTVEWSTPRNYAEQGADSAIRRDDETDEMDAVEHQPEVVAEVQGEVQGEGQTPGLAQTPSEAEAAPLADDEAGASGATASDNNDDKADADADADADED